MDFQKKKKKNNNFTLQQQSACRNTRGERSIFKMQQPDDRQRQRKALDHWEDRKRAWDSLASKLSAKVGKTEGEVLHNTSYQWREKIEELDYLNASIPQHLKSSVLGWEMTLRNQGDGIRYVKFGSSYPYPLYCPVPNNDYLPPDHNVFMKVVSESSDKHRLTQTNSHTKTLRDSDYYNSKETLYKKHITKRFPHKTHEYSDNRLMCIVGEPAPVTTERVEEDIQSPAQHYEFMEETLAATNNNTNKDSLSQASDQIETLAQQEVCDVGQQNAETPHSGPLLLLASTRILFHTEPNLLAHSPLKAVNLGSTAIFYGWKRLAKQPITNSRGEAIRIPVRPSQFVLAESHDGVLLPGEGHMFSFSFRSAVPCIASEEWELTTVPSGKETIIVHLRGVVAAQERDPLSTQFLDRALSKRVTTDMMNNIFLEVLNKGSKENILDESDRSKSSKSNALLTEEQDRISREANRENFAKNNEGCNYTYDVKTFGELQRIWNSVLEVKSNQSKTWNGCVDDLLEEVFGLPDAHQRSEYLKSCDDIISMLSLTEQNSVSFSYAREKSSCLPFYMHLACNQAIYCAVDAVVDSSFFLQEQLGMIESQKRSSKKPAAKKSPPAAQPKPDVESKNVSEVYASEFTESCRSIVLNMIHQVFNLFENSAGRLDRIDERKRRETEPAEVAEEVSESLQSQEVAADEQITPPAD